MKKFFLLFFSIVAVFIVTASVSEKKYTYDVKSPQTLNDLVLLDAAFADIDYEKNTGFGFTLTTTDEGHRKIIADTFSVDDYVLTESTWYPSFIPSIKFRLGTDLAGGTRITLELPDSDVEKLVSSYKSALLENFKKRYSVRTEDHLWFIEDANMLSDIFMNEHVDRWLIPSIRIAGNTADNGVFISWHDSNKIEELRSHLLATNRSILYNKLNSIGLESLAVTISGNKWLTIEIPGVMANDEVKSMLNNITEVALYWDVEDRGKDLEGFKDPLFKAADIENASSDVTPTGEPSVSITLKPSVAETFTKETSDNVGRTIVTILKDQNFRVIDDEKISSTSLRIISEAVVREPLGRRFQISGLPSLADADALATEIRSGSLVSPMYIVDEVLIEPTIGSANVQTILKSLVSALFLLYLYLIFLYGRMGIVASFTITMFAFVVLSVLWFFDATFTLSTLIGVVIAMGMAVDNNILLFEKIKLELMRGHDFFDSLRRTFNEIDPVVLDANITTALAALVLYSLGGDVKGFGLSLFVGAVCAVLYSYVLTKSLVQSKIIIKILGRNTPDV
ncbi:SecDF P1 head subdomain-containing protein [Photobacterium leiognathi]|uniref:SecDF P1 head subdomain-containing protein n=1 Tax=Photobacterium leiognathi TaxID=553611 RepID=UPI0029812467|nr:MMPL family transporter [Photobacterium leiognathi]